MKELEMISQRLSEAIDALNTKFTATGIDNMRNLVLLHQHMEETSTKLKRYIATEKDKQEKATIVPAEPTK